MNLIIKTIYFITYFFLSIFFTKVALADIVVVAYDNFSNKDLVIIDKHIKLLKNKKYYVLSTNNIIDAASCSKILPNYSVAITITSNKKQVINYIWPSMAKASLPFTLFIEPDLINIGIDNMKWEDIKTLYNNGVEIGINGTPRNIIRAIKLYKNNLSIDPISYQYKLGIWSKEEIKILKENKIKIAFGDNSGPVSLKMNIYKLPRYKISGKFSNIERLKTVLETLPLEVYKILPKNNTLISNPPLYGFTLLNNDQTPKCYTNNNNEAEVIKINEDRIEVRTKKFNTSKARINCVSINSNNRLLWHGSLFWVNK